MSVLRPDLMMKCVVPVIMAGIIAVSQPSLFRSLPSLRWHSIYRICTLSNALISTTLDLWSRRICPHCQRTYVANFLPHVLLTDVLMISCTVEDTMPLARGFIQLGAGLSVGLAGLAAGFAVGIVGDAGVRGTAQQPRLFVGMVCLPLMVFMS